MQNQKLYLITIILISQLFVLCSAAQLNDNSLGSTKTLSNSSEPKLDKLVSESPSLATDTKSAPAPSKNVSVVLGSSNPQQAKTFLQYVLAIPCEGWKTSAITFTGKIEPPTNQQISTDTNSLISNNLVIDSTLLKEYRCQLRAERILQRGQRKIIMEAYQFTSPSGAFGAYCAAHRGSTSYLTQGDASSEDQDSISFCKDQYFVYLYSTAPDDDEAKGTINKLAKQLIEYIKPIKNDQVITPSNTQPLIFHYMPNLERVPGSEKLIMGPITLRRFFVAPYSTILAPLTEGAVADYKLDYPDRDRLKLLIARYSSAQQARLVFDNYADTLRSTNKEKAAEGYTFPTMLFKVSDNFLLCQLRDKQIIVINGARHKDSLEQLAHRIYF